MRGEILSRMNSVSRPGDLYLMVCRTLRILSISLPIAISSPPAMDISGHTGSPPLLFGVLYQSYVWDSSLMYGILVLCVGSYSYVWDATFMCGMLLLCVGCYSYVILVDDDDDDDHLDHPPPFQPFAHRKKHGVRPRILT